ncbi:hypothetical protein DPMN_083452 [Dreissena polymorpha]|uniref:NTF2 domain-containing protein n=1 Tax=Dreissena polymorpha TaxID=45954 RepID=A0A9D4BB43_DREPO|nr:hypothetical protein DPMN_083452 [Dreissena polymorpha]
MATALVSSPEHNVLMVTGELSNNGQPMRRFMQTFVLAPQSPKKYYVHNDIFRYQNEVFHDNDTDIENIEDALDSEGEIVDGGAQTELIQDTQQFYDNHAPLSNGTGLLEEEQSEPEEVDDVKEDVAPYDTEVHKEEPKLETVHLEEEPQHIHGIHSIVTASSSSADGDSTMDRRGNRFPYSHQLFVGNLPHNVGEKDLKEFFEGL